MASLNLLTVYDKARNEDPSDKVSFESQCKEKNK